jgi:carbamate kinase
MRPSAFAVTTAIATVMAFSTPSQAQQREITADEVKSYFAQVQLDAMEFVRSSLKPMVGTTNKSMAAMSGAWFRKKVFHP